MRWPLALLLLLPLASAQGHDHAMGSGFAVISDLGPDGDAFVGSPTHFSLIAFGDDNIPDFHQDLPVRVTLDGQLLYETTTTTGHDYDGVHGFDIVFPRAGTWKVAALASGEEVAWLEGEAIEVPLNATPVTIATTASLPPMRQVMIDAMHTDFLIEYRLDGRTILRTNVHGHAGMADWTEGAFEADELIVTAYTAAAEQGAPIIPVTTSQPYVGDSIPIPYVAQPSALAANDVVTAPGDWSLVGTFDPFTTVGPDTLQHLTALVVDGDGQVVRHMNYEISFRGPNGLIFASSNGATLGGSHEHDGIYEMAARMANPGQYAMSVTASRGEWTATIDMPYTVRQDAPTFIAPLSVTGSATRLNQTQEIRFGIADSQGTAFAHGEAEVEVGAPGGLVWLRDKLHTHGTGEFTAMFHVPCQDTEIRIDGFPLTGNILGVPGQTAGTGSVRLAHDDSCIPRWMQEDFGAVQPDVAAPGEPTESSPGIPIAAVMALLAIAVAGRRDTKGP